MRIDPTGLVAGWPALQVRRVARRLRTHLQWGVAEIADAASMTPKEGRTLIRRLIAEGLVEPVGRHAWTLTQAGCTFCAATAAKKITRATAQKALKQFLERVERVNCEPYFLGKVTRAVLFGSLLKPDMERLSDVDLAVQLAPKEPDFDRARTKNYERVETLAAQGHRFRNLIELEGCWYWEVFGFLKGRSHLIALADYSVEKTFILAAPHQFLIGESEELAISAAVITPKPAVKKRRPRDCPF